MIFPNSLDNIAEEWETLKLEEESNTPASSSHGRKLKVLIIYISISLLGILCFFRLSASNISILSNSESAVEQGQHLSRAAADDEYLLGVGKADITGPVVQLNFMGYASLPQVGTGLRQRIYSRAFIVGNAQNPTDRFIYLVLDTSTGDTAIRYGILQALANLGPDYAVYGPQNVAVTGTHSHSGPGGWVNYLLPQVTSLGFDQQSFQAIVDGVILSIQRAHTSLAPGSLRYGSTDIADANINRSPYAYLANPASERAQYSADVDKTLTMLRFQRKSDGKNIGVLTWFPVHGTSMLENNTHVTGDNKGVAAGLFEKAAANDSSAADGFVAGFSQANVGDTSPNVLGAWCDDGSGQMCTFENSTCNGTSQACHGRGPLFQKLDLGVSSCYEVGRRQFAGAKALYDKFDELATPVADPTVKSLHFFQDMSNFTFPLPDGTTAKTCPAALGYSFAGGTTDGPGAFDFTQNENDSSTVNPFWMAVRDTLHTPGPEQIDCQKPKPILLDAGETTTPYLWAPNIVDIQLLRVGQLFIIVSPSEATSMSGRRWRAAINQTAIAMSLTKSPLVVLGGPANTYAHYVATEEEYGIQRYEGASTLYGPHTLNAYINLTVSNMGYLASDSTSHPPPGPSPPNNANNSLSFITGVIYDNPPLLKSFGDVLTKPNSSYTRGSIISTSFVGANPRNNLHLEGTFAAVETLDRNASWVRVRDDSDWSLVYTWKQDNMLLGSSSVHVDWESEEDAALGTYRIVYYGDGKGMDGRITAFEGATGSFTLT